MGLSQSALERRFRREVGASPKKFAALVRLRHVVRLRRAGVSLTDIAHAAGYADQPHFIKDFKRFTGQAPESFFRDNRFLLTSDAVDSAGAEFVQFGGSVSFP